MESPPTTPTITSTTTKKGKKKKNIQRYKETEIFLSFGFLSSNITLIYLSTQGSYPRNRTLESCLKIVIYNFDTHDSATCH